MQVEKYATFLRCVESIGLIIRVWWEKYNLFFNGYNKWIVEAKNIKFGTKLDHYRIYSLYMKYYLFVKN